jgi:hypothetical protein
MKLLRVSLLIILVFALRHGFEDFDKSSNLFHKLKTQNAVLPTLPNCRDNTITSGTVTLDGAAPGLEEVNEWANPLRGETWNAFRKLECAKDYG